MGSSNEYLEYILDQLSDLDEISYRAMMGEYIIYYRGKIVGGIYDDRFLVKPVKSAMAMMPDANMELPYEGAKEMILVEDVENREFLKEHWKMPKRSWASGQEKSITHGIGNWIR